MGKRKATEKEKPVHNFERLLHLDYLDFLSPAQKLAYSVYQQHDVVFLLGPAGTGKTHLAVAFALQELFEKSKSKIVLTRPIVEAGENLGYLPGTLNEKVDPYMMPLYDCINKITKGGQRDYVMSKIEIAPLAYMRGRTFSDSVCILDEAQNCTHEQLKLFLTRLGNGSKMVVTGDPEQSDLYSKTKTPLAMLVDLIQNLKGIGLVDFPEKYIVRHPLVGAILKRLKEAKDS